MRIRILSYKKGSQGAKNIALVLGAKRLRAEGSIFRATSEDILVNWGVTVPIINMPHISGARKILNKPESITGWCNKINFFKNMKEVDQNIIPPFTTDYEEAANWIKDKHIVFCRTILSGSGGRGIVVAHSEEELVNASLYVMYIRKKHEYRAHFFGREVTDYQQKLKRKEIEQTNWEIRNLEGGFIYGREGVSPPPAVREVAEMVTRSTSLDFGAIDIIYNTYRNRAYALEINSAPGLEGHTLEVYRDGIRKIIEDGEEQMR